MKFCTRIINKKKKQGGGEGGGDKSAIPPRSGPRTEL